MGMARVPLVRGHAKRRCYALPSHHTVNATRSAGAGARGLWPGGLGLQLTSQQNLALVFQGGGGHIAVTAQPGAETTLELETREWDYGVQQFMARVQRRRPWWQRWWRRKRPSTSRPASFTVLNKS
jgi:hypothetical protein